MQPHVDMINVFSSGPLKQTLIGFIQKFLGKVHNLTSPLCLANYHLDMIVEMDKAPTELHYRGDNQGTFAIVADG